LKLFRRLTFFFSSFLNALYYLVGPSGLALRLALAVAAHWLVIAIGAAVAFGIWASVEFLLAVDCVFAFRILCVVLLGVMYRLFSVHCFR